MLKRLSKDVALYGGAEFIFKFIAFAVFPIYAHVFSVPEFGIWALLVVTATLFGFILNLGVNQAVQRHYFEGGTSRVDEPVIVSSGLVQLLVSGLIFSGLALLALLAWGDVLARSYGIDRALIVLVLAGILPDQLLQYCLDVLRLHFTPLRFIALAFAKNIIGTALALWFVLKLDLGLHGLFAGVLLGSVAAIPLGLWLIRRDLTFQFDRRVSRSLLVFGAPLVFTSIAHWLYSSMDRWMLAELSSPEELGLFSAAAKYATIITFLIAAFGQAWIPFAIRMGRDDPDHPRAYARIFSLWFLVLALAGLGLALYSREMLILLTPPSFWPAAAILPMLAAGLVLYGTTQITGLGITLAKRTILFAWGTWIAAGTNFLLNLVLIPLYGAAGSAAATLFSYGFLTLYFLFCTQRLRPIPLEKAKLSYSVLLVAVTATVSAVDLGDPDARGFAFKAGVLLVAIVGAFATGVVDRSLFNLIRRKV